MISEFMFVTVTHELNNNTVYQNTCMHVLVCGVVMSWCRDVVMRSQKITTDMQNPDTHHDRNAEAKDRDNMQKPETTATNEW